MNPRRDFFFATPPEVHALLVEKLGNLLEFNEHADATEFLQSLGPVARIKSAQICAATLISPLVSKHAGGEVVTLPPSVMELLAE